MRNRLGINDYGQSASYNFFSYIIKLDGRVTDNKGNFLRTAMPAILHEYFHYYIQFNSAFYLEGFIYNLEIIHQLVLMNNKEIDIPILNSIEYGDIEKTDEKVKLIAYFLYNEEVWLQRMGNVEKGLFDSNISDIKKIVLGLGFNINLPGYYDEKFIIPEIVLNDNRRIIFGELAINEGMAALLDKSLIFKYTNDCNIFQKKYGFPYDILCYFIALTGFSLQDILLISDISMQHPSPGYYFLKLVNKYNDAKDSHKGLGFYEEFYRAELLSEEIKKYREHFSEELSRFNVYEGTPMEWVINKYKSSIKRLDTGELPIYFRLFSEGNDDNIYDIFRGFEPPLFIDDDGIYYPLMDTNNKWNRDESIFSIWRYNMFFRGLYAYRQYLLYGGHSKKCPLFDECKYHCHDKKLREICVGNYDVLTSEYGCEMNRAIKFFQCLRDFEPHEI